MSRLVDYFVIVGFDHEKQRGGLSNGVILQRFPETNWVDTPFHDGIEWFCQPQGWALSTERSEPEFYLSVLTDVDANKHYCACLCFNETVSVTPTKPADEDEDTIDTGMTVANITHHSLMYAPKCIVIVSRQDYIDTFKNCLGIIYTVWVENVGVPLETLVGNLLGGVVVTGPGGPAVRFSLGAGDRQCLQPPAAPPLPVTNTSVHTLLRLLGIHNTITLWCAVMCEHKVLLVSLAAARLAAVCRALAALMFPFRYAHVYIPLLPAGLSDVLATPTPFLIGVHSSIKEDVNELLDVIVADLDVGSLRVPTGVSIPRPSSRVLSRLQGALALVLQPELRAADVAFAPPPPAASPPHLLDKELRAVFMRTLAGLLQGYRHCLTVIRTVPSPVLAFHKAGFVGSRGLDQCPFTQRLLDSMFFSGFVHERGAPWRPTDIFDDLIQNLPEQFRLESINQSLELQHIQELAMQVHLNENPNPQIVQQRVLRPPLGSASRVHQPPFPLLDVPTVNAVLTELAHRNAQHKVPSIRGPPARIVPIGAPPTGAVDEHSYLLANSARRLEVLSSCVSGIFEGRCSEASKSIPAVVRALKAPVARAALLQHLAARTHNNKHLLQHHQFDLVVKLMNCALQSCTPFDEHCVAAAMLPLATAYCRKLCTGVIQYAYMRIQDHAIWTSQQFWEAAYYQEVQKDIRALYLPNTPPPPRDDEEYVSLLRAQEPTALEIAAEQMRIWPSLDPEKQAELKTREESILYSQALHYANRMVYLLLPLEGAGRRSEHRADETDRASNSFTNSVAESDSVDAESGFEEADPGEAGNNVIKMVSRFIDKVCTEGNVSANHVRSLHQMVPGVVHMQLETLDHVARESRRLPPIQKPHIVSPSLVPGEVVEKGGLLRCVLVPDGRHAPPLPAEGALFLTNYRVLFQGLPTDPFACEQPIVRSFPVCSLTREKSIRTTNLPHVEQCGQEGLQLRSATFQLIKVALDEEVTAEQVEVFRKSLSRLRHPQHPLLHFAFCGRPTAPIAHHHLAKNNTLKGFAKKTLLKTARKAGLKPKPSKRQKYVLPSADSRSLTSPPLMSSISADTLSLEDLDIGVVEPEPVSDARTLERLRDRAYVRDWARVGLSTAPFTLSLANATYCLTRTYPAVIPVPDRFSEEALRRLARQYRHGRLPVITWRHSRNGALLVRSAAPHHKGVMGMLKSSHQTQTMPQPGTEPTSSLEQDRYLATLAACTPMSRGDLEDSSLSLDSLLLCYEDNPHVPHTPLLTKAAGTLNVLGRGSGGVGGVRGFPRWGSLRGQDLTAQRYSLADVDDGVVGGRPPLMVMGERGGGGAGGEHVPVEPPDPRLTRHAFKKLMRATVPSNRPTQPDHSYYKLIEESGWLWLLRQLFQISGAVVDLIDLQGSSVLVSLEDGWDATTQISSLAQVCLDPYYRTLEGFRVLIEKEWLAMGHKFQTRSNLGPNPTNTFTPTFIMFLDAVHQLQKQFPMSFEFNDLYLRFVAYHSVSCRFRTFLTDSEAQRADLGITTADHKRDSARMGIETGAEEGGALGQSVFEHIEKAHQKTPLFYNFLYTPDFDNPVLRPVYSIPMLEIWEYYVSEELGGSSPYELDVPVPGRPRDCRTVTAGLDPLPRCLPDAFTALLDRARQLDLELAHLPQKWKVRWDQLELPNTLQLQRAASLSSCVVRLCTRVAHKRGTLELVVRGRMTSQPPPHRWAPASLTQPHHCDHCNALLWGPVKSGVRCSECGAVCHCRCADMYSAPCLKTQRAPEPTHVANRAPSTCGTSTSLQQYYHPDFSSNVAENRTHEGHLYKRGALLKGWKQRWFVLDSIKHQLRYYDAMEDSHCKGFIELAEVIAVTQAPPAPGPPKKCDDRSFFDLRTSRRTYNFCASDANAAQEWIEKLQACLQ